MLEKTRLRALLVFTAAFCVTHAVHAQSVPKQTSKGSTDGAAAGSEDPAGGAQGVAQHSPATSAAAGADDQLQEIVVTGTLLRGIAPTGTNLINVSQADVEASGAV